MSDEYDDELKSGKVLTRDMPKILSPHTDLDKRRSKSRKNGDPLLHIERPYAESYVIWTSNASIVELRKNFENRIFDLHQRAKWIESDHLMAAHHHPGYQPENLFALQAATKLLWFW